MIIKTWEMKKCIYCDDEISAENPLDYCRKCHQMDKCELADMLLKQIDELKQQRGYWESKISELFNQTSCAECGNRHKCEIMPKPGEFARINCWFYVKDNDQTKPDVADTDVGNIAEPTHGDCKNFYEECSDSKHDGNLPKAKDCKHFERKDEPITKKPFCHICKEVRGVGCHYCHEECSFCKGWYEPRKHQKCPYCNHYKCEKDSCDQCNECGSIDAPGSEKTDEPKKSCRTCGYSYVELDFSLNCSHKYEMTMPGFSCTQWQPKEPEKSKCTECNRRKKVLKKRNEKIRNQRRELALLNRRFSELKAVKADEIVPLWFAALNEKITCRCDTLKAKCRAYENAITSQAVCANKWNIFQCVVCKHTHNCLSYCRYEFDFERFGDKGGDE